MTHVVGDDGGGAVAREVSVLVRVGRLVGEPLAPAALGQRILATIHDIVPFAAAELSIWDPVNRTHRTLTNAGYADPILAYLNDGHDIGFRRALELRRPLRWGSAPYDYRETYAPQHVFGPAGYDEGMTACLFTDDGRYTGVLNLNTTDNESVTDRMLELFNELGSTLAHVTDVTRAVAWYATLIDPDAAAVAVTPGGALLEIPGRSTEPILGSTPAFVGLAREFLRSGHERRRFLWLNRDHGWHRVQILRTREATVEGVEVALVTAAGTSLPFDLTARELDVLTLVARGFTNGEIAIRLRVGTRTVATHLERLFEKLGQVSRAGLAATAVEEGLLRLRPDDEEVVGAMRG